MWVLITLKFFFLQRNESVGSEEIIENNDIGEHEDADVKAERTRVCEILNSQLQNPPVVIVQVIFDFG